MTGFEGWSLLHRLALGCCALIVALEYGLCVFGFFWGDSR